MAIPAMALNIFTASMRFTNVLPKSLRDCEDSSARVITGGHSLMAEHKLYVQLMSIY